MRKKIIMYLLLCSICILNIKCSNIKKYGKKSIDYKDTLSASTKIRADWTGAVHLDQNDIWFVLFDNGIATYDFRIGTNGVISEMRDRTESFKALLSPCFNKEQTDRVIQWTIWSSDLIRNVNYRGREFEQRYNVTQGGTFTNQLHQTLGVEINNAKNQIDVYGKADLQWKLDNQSVMTGSHTALTRYSYDPRGFLKVYRVVSVGEPKLNGVVQQWNDLYFEGWIPMKGDGDVFTGIALGFDSQGEPNDWYLKNHNIPTYPYLKVSDTNGYAVVFNNQDKTGKDAVGIVYGTENIVASRTDASYVLNTLEWDTGIGVLPAILVKGKLPANSLIEQTLYIVPRSGLSAEMSGLLTTLSGEIPAPNIYKPSEIPVGSELETIYTTIMENDSIYGTKTDHLRPLISNNYFFKTIKYEWLYLFLRLIIN
jgi:hypothetical protein